MAGSEKTGWEHGTADLFVRRTCFVTPLPRPHPPLPPPLWKFRHDLGAEPVTVDPDKHDEIVVISHSPGPRLDALRLPRQRDLGWRNFAGNGLRDTTRIAASDPQLWRTISNRISATKFCVPCAATKMSCTSKPLCPTATTSKSSRA